MMTRTSLSAATRAQRDESARSSFQPQPLAPPHPRKPAAPPLNTYEPPSYQLPLAPYHPRKLFVDQSSKLNADRACPLPFAQTHPRKLSGVCPTPNKSAFSARPLPLAQYHPRKLFVDQSSKSNADRACPLPIAQTHPRKLFGVCLTPNKSASSARPLPLAQIHPRNSPNARARSEEKSKLLIYGSAIKTPRKPFENSNLRNSNRR